MTINRDYFPNLNDDAFHETSDASEEYNCIAWAAGVDNEWWDPFGGSWPDNVPRDSRAGAFVQLYEHYGFVECNDAEHEPGHEKVAIYLLGRDVEHAARQLPNGKWTSKLGPDEDIEHDSLNDLAGDFYGEPVRFLKRKIAD